MIANEGKQDSEYRGGEPVSEEHVTEQPSVPESPDPSVLETEVVIAVDAPEESKSPDQKEDEPKSPDQKEDEPVTEEESADLRLAPDTTERPSALVNEAIIAAHSSGESKTLNYKDDEPFLTKILRNNLRERRLRNSYL
jgi:hypothetical protein